MGNGEKCFDDIVAGTTSTEELDAAQLVLALHPMPEFPMGAKGKGAQGRGKGTSQWNPKGQPKGRGKGAKNPKGHPKGKPTKGKGRGRCRGTSGEPKGGWQEPRPKDQIPCRFHAKGNCKKGTECPYLHNTE